MPTISVDTFFACSLMVMVVVASMAGVAKLIQPYLTEISEVNEQDYLRELSKFLLLNEGSPRDWGQQTSVPKVFGLAKSNASIPYELDIDKVSRLNRENSYAVTYSQLLEALGVDETALKIEVKTLFNVSIQLVSNTSNGDETSYTFQVSTSKSGLPVAAEVRCYIVARNFVAHSTLNTSSDGAGNITLSIPNSSNGTALLIAFAKSTFNFRVVSFNIYAFGHLSSDPLPNQTFTELSPLNYTLHVSFVYPNENLSNVYVFTHNYHFNLTEIESGVYQIPNLRDISPMILTVAGSNASTYFVEWVSYPQIPLETGASFSSSEGIAFVYPVVVHQVLYECKITCAGAS